MPTSGDYERRFFSAPCSFLHLTGIKHPLVRPSAALALGQGAKLLRKGCCERRTNVPGPHARLFRGAQHLCNGVWQVSGGVWQGGPAASGKGVWGIWHESASACADVWFATSGHLLHTFRCPSMSGSVIEVEGLVNHCLSDLHFWLEDAAPLQL